MFNYIDKEFIIGNIFIIVMFVVILLNDFIRKYKEYSKNKQIKVKYLPCIPKPMASYGFYITLIIIFFPSILLDIKNFNFYRKEFGSDFTMNIIYSSIIPFLISCAIFFAISYFWQIISGNIMLISDKFIVFYTGRINLGEVNYVDIFPIKGFFKRRKIDVYVNGKLHMRFTIRDKYTSDIINIFTDRCKVL